jgi:general secretion pathway protein G
MKEKPMNVFAMARGRRTVHRPAVHRRAADGFTLVELIVVITIIGVLTAAISVGVMAAKKSADLKLAKTACNTIRDATIQWKAVHSGEDCPTIDQLRQEKILDTGFSVKDPWGSLFKVACDSDEITCTTPGPDRKEGTDDDIHVPQADVPGGGGR